MNNIPDHQTLCAYVQGLQNLINNGDGQNAWEYAQYLIAMPIEFEIQATGSQMINPLPIYGMEFNQWVYDELKDIGYDETTCKLGATGTATVEDAIKNLKEQLIYRSL
ncbi:unnamed protein product [Blepharisma stoltei]|uniref:Uncharacterized protein n=1 Tax=Blepharisma stoltei TaxID=1481888 RepID=A0AAU9JE86_9CILI|nr:unnamed protein product [Blepharisma stoltei]